jgi:hypothetical protein
MTAEERRLEVFETPPHYVEPLLAHIGPLDGLAVYEPCVGRGHIARYLFAAGAQLLTNDINPDCLSTMHLDARAAEAWPKDRSIDWTITNPPFSDELAILRRALAASRNVAFLARLSFLEPTIDRGPFWEEHPLSDLIVLPRYSFRLNEQGKRQTDNVTCCWLVFREYHASTIRFSSQRTVSVSNCDVR